jgi:hypothetical protein
MIARLTEKVEVRKFKPRDYLKLRQSVVRFLKWLIDEGSIISEIVSYNNGVKKYVNNLFQYCRSDV